jgi:NADPH:quinone reductase-like Zn-dependent oxidoreductase
MRAAGIDRFGAAVRPITLPDPRPLAPDEVLIRVIGAGVGNWDEFARVGDWDIGRRPPMALGVEAAGVVTAVGERVSRWVPGDQVMTHAVPVREQGAWAEQLIVDGDLLASKPEDVPWDEAAAFPVPALTAAQALHEVTTTTTASGLLLVHGAGGVTGGMVAALARARGTRVIATAGTTSADRLKRLGVEAVFDYHDHDWPKTVLAFTKGAGVPAAVNAARGGEPATLSAVADGGRFAYDHWSATQPAAETVDRQCLRARRPRAAGGTVWTVGSTRAGSAHRRRLPPRAGSGGAGARDQPWRSGRGRASAVNPPSASVVNGGRVPGMTRVLRGWRRPMAGRTLGVLPASWDELKPPPSRHPRTVPPG